MRQLFTLNTFRLHWFDFGIILAVLLSIGLIITRPQGMELLMWLSFGSLLLHQTEEWRFPGYFPGMLNVAMFKSQTPDRYPLNANSGMIINVVIGWGSYLLAALLWDRMMWLAIATLIVSAGNIVAHTFIFNFKGKTLYNPGLITSWLCFFPIICEFFILTNSKNLISIGDWVLGLTAGALLNYFGVYHMVEVMANRHTEYVFPKRFLVPEKTSL